MATTEGAALAIELVKGDHGVFDVRADGALIFSKKAEGRFPTPRGPVSSSAEPRGVRIREMGPCRTT